MRKMKADTYQVDRNQLTLLQNGQAYFPQLCADIDAARRFIYLETYIFAADNTGFVVSAALQRAAKRGVIVRVLMDGFGSADLPQQWLDEMSQSGMQVHVYRRELYRFRLHHHRLRRLHRKLVVVDGEVAFVGGINIIDDLSDNGHSIFPRFDFAVRVQGDMVGEVHRVMHRMWKVVAWVGARHMQHFVKFKQENLKNIKLLLRDNLRHRRDIEYAYLSAIGNAQSEIIIANAYFLPGRKFRHALIDAVHRGVRVVLLLQGKIEHRLLHYATHALYQQLLEAGIEIHEYQSSFLHAKVAVIDGMWTTIGSSNIDPFSLLLAREANLAVTDTGFADALRNKLTQAIALHASQINPSYWRKLFWPQRFIAKFSYALIRTVIGLLGYGKSS
jgi:cardiolipin synthase